MFILAFIALRAASHKILEVCFLKPEPDFARLILLAMPLSDLMDPRFSLRIRVHYVRGSLQTQSLCKASWLLCCIICLKIQSPNETQGSQEAEKGEEREREREKEGEREREREKEREREREREWGETWWDSVWSRSASPLSIYE